MLNNCKWFKRRQLLSNVLRRKTLAFACSTILFETQDWYQEQWRAAQLGLRHFEGFQLKSKSKHKAGATSEEHEQDCCYRSNSKARSAGSSRARKRGPLIVHPVEASLVLDLVGWDVTGVEVVLHDVPQKHACILLAGAEHVIRLYQII